MALRESVEMMFQRNQQTHPDPDLNGVETTIDAAPVLEFTNADDAVAYNSEASDLKAVSPKPKNRVVIISKALKYSTKNYVYNVHKGRQNADRGIQVGRSWLLETLMSVDCHNRNENLLVVGFKKPYYWVFANQKLRDHFAETLRCVFKDYTGRVVPEAYGPEVPTVSRRRSVKQTFVPYGTSQSVHALPIPPHSLSQAMPIQVESNLQDQMSQSDYHPSNLESPELQYAPNKQIHAPHNQLEVIPQPPPHRSLNQDDVPQIPKRAPTRSHRNVTPQKSEHSLAIATPLVNDRVNLKTTDEVINLGPSVDSPVVPPRNDQTPDMNRVEVLERQRSIRNQSSEKLGSAFEPSNHPMPNVVASEQVNSMATMPGMASQGPSTKYTLTSQFSPGQSQNVPMLNATLEDLITVIEDIGWNGDSLTFLEMEIKQKIDILSNQNFTSVVNIDDQLGDYNKMVLKSITECRTVDSKLQAVAMNLAGRRGEVFDIENREDGLQVSSLNYRKLAQEIENLLEFSSLDDQFIFELHELEFQASTSLKHVEDLLLDLYQALEMFSHRMSNGSSDAIMQALQEPKRTAEELAHEFSEKLYSFLSSKFKKTFESVGPFNSTETFNHDKVVDSFESQLFQHFYDYSGCILFVRDTMPKIFQKLLSLYENLVSKIYQTEFQRSSIKWGQNIQNIVVKERRNDGVLSPAPFSSARSSSDVSSFASAAVDKTQKITLSLPLQNKIYEQFQIAVDSLCFHVSTQQRFVEMFFHLGTNESQKFPNFVNQEPLPKGRKASVASLLEDMENMCYMESSGSSNTAHLVHSLMQNKIFSSLQEHVLKSWGTSLSNVHLESAYLLFILDIRNHELRKTNQQFLSSLLNRIYRQRSEQWEEETRQHTRNILSVRFKTKKRVGVHPVVKMFTEVVQSIEYSIKAAQDREQKRLLKVRNGNFEIYTGDDARKLVDKCHENMFRAISQGLRMGAANTELQTNQGTAARLKAAATPGGASSLEETKELLNRHVVMIENLYQIFTDLGGFHSVGIQKIVNDATIYYKQELNSYITDVISRPLVKIMTFLHQYEPQVANVKQKECATALKRAVKGVDRKEVKIGVDQLRKRVEKHFTGSEPSVFINVWKAIGDEYANVYQRLCKIAQTVDAMHYIDFQQSDFTAAFR